MRISDLSSYVCSSDLVEAEHYSFGHTDLEQTIANLLIVAAENLVRSVNDGHLAAEFMKDPGEFVGDIAPASDHHPLRQGFQMKNFVGSNAKLVRSEEHTSELQSLMRISYAVFCLKKKKRVTR